MTFWDWPADANVSETSDVVDLLLADIRSGNSNFWTVRLREEGAFVGLCDLSEIQNGGAADIGFMLVRKFWGAGLGSEVVACLLAHARDLGLKSVGARIHSDNARSRRLLMRAGFKLVEELPDFEIRPGVHRDCVRLEAQLQIPPRE
jgi:ribosomal-protein-alanine N-acetyltransferase